MTGRIVSLMLWLLAVLFVAAFVHLASILILPYVAPHDAFDRLAAGQPVAALTPVTAAATGRGPPFKDPASSSAVCRYDLASGPLRVTAATQSGDFLAVSFHSRFGLPFYALTDRASVDGRIDVLLMTEPQLKQFEAADGDEPARDVRIVAPEADGFVEFDVVPRIGGAVAAERALKSVGCKVETGP